MTHMKAYALKCPGCGAALKVGETVDSFACAYCAASVRVERGGGIVSLQLLTDAIAKVQTGTDRTAAELALVRLNAKLSRIRRDVQELEKQSLDPPYMEKRPLASQPFPLFTTSVLLIVAFFALCAGGISGEWWGKFWFLVLSPFAFMFKVFHWADLSRWRRAVASMKPEFEQFEKQLAEFEKNKAAQMSRLRAKAILIQRQINANQAVVDLPLK